MISVTEILGTDGLNASRITINNNFRVLKDAINRFGDVVSIEQSSIRIGDGSYPVSVPSAMSISNNLTVSNDVSCTNVRCDKVVIGAYELDVNLLQQIVEYFENQPTE